MGLRINLGRGSKNLNSTQGLAFAAVFALIGVAIAGYGFTQYQGQQDYLENTENISATVTDNSIRTDSSRRGGIDYQAEISFEYSFQGENFSSNFIHPLDTDKEFNSETEAEKFLEDYQEGETVDAFVDPDNPDEAFLKAERSSEPLLMMIIGALLTGLGSYKVVQRTV